MTHALQVELGERRYPIHIGTGILDAAALYEPHIRGRQVDRPAIEVIEAA